MDIDQRNNAIVDDYQNMTLEELKIKYGLSLTQLSRIIKAAGVEKSYRHPCDNIEWLQSRLDGRKTARAMAIEAGVSKGTMVHWIRRLQGKTKPKTHQINKAIGEWSDNAEWFKHQYEELGNGIPTIAKHIGRSFGFVSGRLKRYGIERRSLHEAMRKFENRPDKAWLEQNYIVLGYSISKCADLFGTGFGSMLDALRECNIPLRSASEQHVGPLNSFFGQQHTEETKKSCAAIGAKHGREYWLSGDVEAKRELVRLTSKEIWSDPERRAAASVKIAELCSRGGCNAKTTVYVATNGTALYLRSSWEDAVARFLDDDPNVVEWQYEDTIIQYMDESDEIRNYVVDFTIIWSDGSKTLLEVKNEHLLEQSKEQIKIAALREYCENHGYSCLILSDKADIKRLLSGARPRIDWITNNRFAVKRKYLECSSLAIESMVKALMARTIPWASPTYTEAELQKDIRRLQTENLAGYGELQSTAPNSGGMPGRLLMQHFQPHFWDVAYKGRQPLPAAFSDRSLIEKCIRISIKEKESLSLERLLREINFHGSGRYGRTSHFAPGFARRIIRMMDASGKAIFDPCCGWGGRLLGAWLEGCEYNGCDLSPPTVVGLQALAAHVESKAHITLGSCLDAEWPDADLIFTSPPFFDIEQYIGDEQPWMLGSRDKWLDQFVKPFVDKIGQRRSVLYLDGKTRADYEEIRPFSKVVPVANRRHARRKVESEYLCIYE